MKKLKLKDIWNWLQGNGPTLVVNARDGDGDGIIQEGTPFERPAKKKAPAKKPVAKKPVATAKKTPAKAPAKAPAKKATPKKK
jgi:hypothetical protein